MDSTTNKPLSSTAAPSMAVQSTDSVAVLPTNGAEPLLTRHELAKWLSEQGYKISYSTLTKYCSPAINCGAPAEGYWGRLPIYKPSRSLAWARARLRPAPATLIEDAET